MKIKQLGNSTLPVSTIGLGCMGMSDFYGQTDEQESLATLSKALDLGINFFDTADMYGYGENEKLLAKILKNNRDKIILATKFGFVRDQNDVRTINGKPEYVKQACDASLLRLGTDVIDLYYLHRVDKNVPIEETVGAMADLVKAGKVRYLGLSEASPKTITRAHKIHPITALQSEYSLWCRTPEKEIIPLCEELNITFVPYSPLGRGFLTNKIPSPDSLDKNDFRRALPRLNGENLTTNLNLVQQLAKIAERKNCTPAQLALAWVLAQSKQIVPIPGTKRRKYLEENVAGTEIVLTSEDLTTLNTVFKPEAVKGDRYTEQGMALMDNSG